MSTPPSSDKDTQRRRAKPPGVGNPPVETAAAILEAAEQLFIDKGYAGTSVRAIATKAGVNLASAHYHFGSKAGLLGAVIHLRVAPANEERERRLDALERETPNPSVEQILEVFFSTLALDGVAATLPRLIARLYGEPESVSQPLIEREFGAVSRRFLAALGAAMPDVDAEVLAWRFYFMIGAMIHMLAFEGPHTMDPAERRSEDSLRRLLEFAVAGITNGVPRAPEEK